MINKVVLLAITVVAFFSVNSFSQTSPIYTTPPVLQDNDLDYPEYFTIGDITGSIGGAKAVYLAKPTFPMKQRKRARKEKLKSKSKLTKKAA